MLGLHTQQNNRKELNETIKKLAKVLDEIENMKREIFELKIKISVKEIDAEKLKEKYEKELTKLRKFQS